MINVLRYGAAAALVGIVATDAAIAGIIVVPGPVIGAGAPALAVFAAGYWLIRAMEVVSRHRATLEVA